MARLAAGWLLVVALLFVPAVPSYAARGGHGGGHGGWHGSWHGGGRHGGWHGSHWRGGVFIGGPWWWGGPYYAYPYPYPYWYRAYPPYYAYPPSVPQQPQVYIQQQPPERSEKPVAGYWYYCASAKAYYPAVQTCPEAWIKVPPAPQQGD